MAQALNSLPLGALVLPPNAERSPAPQVWGAPMSGTDLLNLGPKGPRAGEGDGGSGHVLTLRDPRTAVAALVAAWESGRFAIDPQPPGWWGTPWSCALVDGWQALIGQPTAFVCAHQWLTLQLAAMRTCPPGPAIACFEDLVGNPRGEEVRLSALLGTQVRVRVDEPGDPWRRPFDLGEVGAALQANQALLQEYLDLVDELAPDRATVGAYRQALPEEQREPAEFRQPSEGTRFHSQFTTNLPELLAATGSSLLITTYKSGHAIIARTPDGTGLDTYFTSLDRPMGAAVAGNRLAIGTADSVVVYARHATAVPGLDPAPDAVLVPKAIMFTGDVAVHDMAWDDQGTLWFVNTAFSCLSTLQPYASFDCAWKPAWITDLAAEDRCHLNGLTMRDGRPRYVTALAMTNTPAGWRAQRGNGGVIIDITTDEVVADGLCMPHSPRWYADQLWFLQSGAGTLNVLQDDGTSTVVATLPGFTRGLTFVGPYALVGLSQVRESVFTDLPITSTAAERNCGVWIVDTRSGTTVGHLRFSGGVTEIFDTHVLPARWPHIAEPGHLTRTCYALDPQTLTHIRTQSDNQPAPPSSPTTQGAA